MEVTVTATSRFDGGHRIPLLARCSHHHGHEWWVWATVTGDLDPKTGWPRGAETLPDELEAFAVELRGRDIDEMLPGTTTSPLGIASVVLDRMALRFPRLTGVRVACSDGTEGEIKRAPRQL